MIGKVKKWEVKKWEGDKKVKGKRFNFLSFVFGWEDGKVERWKTYLFGWGKKNERQKRKVDSNLQLCPH